MKIRVHCWGGLAGQLTGLITAMWIEKELGRTPYIIFHDGGVSRRPLEIRDLGSGYEIRVAHESAAIDTGNAQNHLTSQVLKFKCRVSMIVGCAGRAMKLILPEEALTQETLRNGVHPLTLSCRGYCPDLRMHRDVLDELSRRIATTSRPNFLEDAGREPFIAVHWRLGDYLMNPNANEFHGTITTSSLERAISSIPESDLPVRIFTDSVDLVKIRIVESEQLRSAVIVSQDIWTDLYEMSRAQYFIGSHSGVSLWAALAIERGGRGSVFLPSSWVKNNSSGDYEPLGMDVFHRYECSFD